MQATGLAANAAAQPVAVIAGEPEAVAAADKPVQATVAVDVDAPRASGRHRHCRRTRCAHASDVNSLSASAVTNNRRIRKAACVGGACDAQGRLALPASLASRPAYAGVWAWVFKYLATIVRNAGFTGVLPSPDNGRRHKALPQQVSLVNTLLILLRDSSIVRFG
jgi:hypothetical protein